MKRKILAAVAVVAVLLAAFGAWTFWPRGTNEVSEQDAVDDFRDRTTTPTSPETEDDPTTPAIPEPGVYTFAAEGSEDVKLGPLPAQTRPFPDQVTATVVDEGGGCFQLTLSFFEEHTEDTRYCATEDGLTLVAHTKHQKIGALSPTGEMSCDPSVLLATGQDEQELTCTLDLTGAPVAISASLAGTATAGETEEVTIGTETVDVTPLTIVYDVSGDLSGTWTETLWLTESHLPVRIERTLDLSGPATFSEQSRLDLEDLTPST